MRTPTLIMLALATALVLAGCMEEESTEDRGGEAREFTIEVPDGATQVHVHVEATADSGEPDVAVLVESARGDNLGSETFSVRGSTSRTVSVDASGHETMKVTVRVVDGDANLDVRVTATVPQQPDVVIIHETIVIRTTTTTVEPTPTPSSPTAPAPTPTPPSPTPPAATPSPTPTPMPPPTTNSTNSTNGTNTTG